MPSELAESRTSLVTAVDVLQQAPAAGVIDVFRVHQLLLGRPRRIGHRIAQFVRRHGGTDLPQKSQRKVELDLDRGPRAGLGGLDA